MSIGKHIIVDYYGIDPALLCDEDFLNRTFAKALETTGAHILHRTSHCFDAGGGVTGLFLLSESHASYHSYPEFQYIAVDVFTCGGCDPASAVSYIEMILKPLTKRALTLPRATSLPAAAFHPMERLNKTPL